MRFTKEMVLRHISESQIFRYYLGCDFKLGVSFRSPFRDERNPSFNIYKSDGGRLYFKDFASNKWGDCFDFVMEKYNIKLNDAITMIGIDFDIANLEGFSDKINNRKNMIRTYANKLNLNISVHEYKKEEEIEREMKVYDCKELDSEESKQIVDSYFFGKYKIQYMGTASYYVSAVSKVSFISNSQKKIEIVSETNNPIFKYKGYGDERSVRFYRPFANENQIKHFGSIAKGDYFGKKYIHNIAKINKNLDRLNVIFCAGQKDAMCVTEHFLNCIGVAMGSEGNKIPMEILTELYMLGFKPENIFVLYDNDKTGIERSIKISKETGLQYIVSSSLFRRIGDIVGVKNLTECKDISDVFEVIFKEIPRIPYDKAKDIVTAMKWESKKEELIS